MASLPVALNPGYLDLRKEGRGRWAVEWTWGGEEVVGEEREELDEEGD